MGRQIPTTSHLPGGQNRKGETLAHVGEGMMKLDAVCTAVGNVQGGGHMGKPLLKGLNLHTGVTHTQNHPTTQQSHWQEDSQGKPEHVPTQKLVRQRSQKH